LLDVPGQAAGPADLVIAVIADDATAAEAAAAVVEAGLVSRRAATTKTGAVHPRALHGGLRALPDATLALISVPGAYAGAEARRALDAGLHVMLFSDNVPVETEVELKDLALARGLFLMGPDCGTAIVAGVPLGFANAVPRGRVGIVAASGTGLQEVSCRLAGEGEGLSHAIGVGGRDLSDVVGGRMTLAALSALAADKPTEVVVIVGKPPGDAVARRLTEALAAVGKPIVLCLPGRTTTPSALQRALTVAGSIHHAPTLEDAALAAVALARGEAPRPLDFTRPGDEVAHCISMQASGLARGQRFVRGLYTGGTLALEAVAILSARLPGVTPGLHGEGMGHRVVDLGDDRFTVGRPHPMIDGAVRADRIAREADDPAAAVLLLDVVLGYGAHPDPAAELSPALEAARRAAMAGGRGLAVVASVTGTEQDPQVRSRQVATLRAAGVVVMDSNAQAARLAALIAERVAGGGP
jgi:succinyl-CoA synthetase alpha subunit